MYLVNSREGKRAKFMCLVSFCLSLFFFSFFSNSRSEALEAHWLNDRPIVAVILFAKKGKIDYFAFIELHCFSKLGFSKLHYALLQILMRPTTLLSYAHDRYLPPYTKTRPSQQLKNHDFVIVACFLFFYFSDLLFTISHLFFFLFFILLFFFWSIMKDQCGFPFEQKHQKNRNKNIKKTCMKMRKL